MAGIGVATAVGHELVIDHPFDHAEPAWLGVILGGPALFLIGRSLFEYVEFSRVSRSRLIGLLALVAGAPSLAAAPPLGAAIAAAAVLVLIVAPTRHGPGAARRNRRRQLTDPGWPEHRDSSPVPAGRAVPAGARARRRPGLAATTVALLRSAAADRILADIPAGTGSVGHHVSYAEDWWAPKCAGGAGAVGSTSKRATPADPLPGITVDVRTAGQEVATLPPGLGPDAIGVLDGRTFMYSDASGDVPPGSIGGLLVEDTRYLNRWLLTINGQRLIALGSAATDYYSADFFLTNAGHPELPANAIDVRRRRIVGRNGLHEGIDLASFAAEPARIELRLQVGTDFADLLEIRAGGIRDRSAKITREHAADGSRLQFRYANGGFSADTVVHANPPATRIDGDDLVWNLDLLRGEHRRIDLHVPLALGPMDLPSVHIRFDEGEPRNDPTSRWHAERPNIETDSQLLAQVQYKASDDILTLRARIRIGDQEVILPGAGMPWFLTLFGRDALISAYQTIVLNPYLARGTLIALARFQGTKCDDFTDEEPGRILHEVRGGELTQLGEKPYGPYYGTADATQLWLILLSEYWRWTGDDEFVRTLRDHAIAALNWIDRYGDRDRDGYVEYATRSPEGLGNQCWRDSWDGIQFSDGELPVLPIATCEIQGYTYDAKLRTAELADGPLADPALAARLREEARQLFERFNRDFWIDGRGGYYAVGLDGDKRRIDSMTSSMGHLLWSGIVPDDRAPIVARHLMSDPMFSGWGIRTLSTEDRGYNPIGYHSGTVWPHETSLIAAGLTRYGFRTESNQLALALLDAAKSFDFRLPETFAGHSRGQGKFPVPYPTPCSPQAWATGAPALIMRAMLGGDARNGEVVLDPHLPDEIGRILITRLPAFGKRWNLEAVGAIGHVRLTT